MNTNTAAELAKALKALRAARDNYVEGTDTWAVIDAAVEATEIAIGEVTGVEVVG